MSLRRRINIDDGNRVTREIKEFRDEAELRDYKTEMTKRLRAGQIRRFSVSEKNITKRLI